MFLSYKEGRILTQLKRTGQLNCVETKVYILKEKLFTFHSWGGMCVAFYYHDLSLFLQIHIIFVSSEHIGMWYCK